MKIVVIGSSNIDMVAQVNHLPLHLEKQSEVFGSCRHSAEKALTRR